MEEEITLEHEGESYSASYIQVDDELLTYLPDGSERRSILRGLTPRDVASRHLRGYLSTLKRKG